MFGNFNGQTVKAADGFTPPAYHGTVAVKYATVAYTDTTAKPLFVLPKGAILVGWLVNVSTAFNGSTTDVLDIGTSATGDAYAADLSVASAGQLASGFVVGALFTALTDDVTVTATYADGAGDATMGAATICAFYILS